MVELKTILTLNAGLFSVIGLVHLSRVIWQWEVSFAGWNVPLWLNGVFVILASVLAWVNWKQRK